MKIETRTLTIRILAFLGLALAVKLAFIYYAANYDKTALASFCSINDFVDCDGAARSTTAQFLGIPLAYWGILFYLTTLFLTFVDKLKNFKYLKFLEVFKAPMQYITVLGTIAFIISAILALISIFGIKKLCILCWITYIIDLTIAIIAADANFTNTLKSFKTTVIDFIDGAKQYIKTFIVLLLLAVSFLAYSGITLNFVPNVKAYKSIMKFQKMKYNPYRVHGNVLGNPKGDVVVELFSDYVCPLCYIQNIMLHKAVKEFKNVRVIHYNYPFDKSCNPYVSTNMHAGACLMSRAAIAASKQGDYWGMASLLYENHPKKYTQLMVLAGELGFKRNKFLYDIDSKETNEELQRELKRSAYLGINATPTVIINGEKVVGVRAYFKLTEILQKHGAQRK